MSNLISYFNEALVKHGAPEAARIPFSFRSVDEFTKEAYRIKSHIASLKTYIRSVRQAYLSSSQPNRHGQSRGIGGLWVDSSSGSSRQPLSNDEREQVDAYCKQLLRELNAAIRNLNDAEELRQNTQTQLARRKFGKAALGAMGRWAAGGAKLSKSAEEEAEESSANGVKVHRESVIWFLRRKLEECSEVQREMMEIRLTREIEKSKSVLYKTRGAYSATTSVEAGKSQGLVAAGSKESKPARGGSGFLDESEEKEIGQRLSPDQLQLFAQENQDMVKYYEDALDQVRTAERSLLDISELQTTLANNLSVQAAHIDQLVADSFSTTENVGSGNKELKRATERQSTAKYVFYGSCTFSLLLIVYDLLI